jgi:hypothetical protein
MAKQTINVGSTANDGTGDKLRDAFVKVNDNFTELYSDDAGDVNSVTAGTGISVNQTTGAVIVTNSDPDQTVVLTGGTGITTSGTYPNFTITNSDPDQTVSLTGVDIAVSGTYPSFTLTNSAPNANHTGDVTGATALTIANDTIDSDRIGVQYKTNITLGSGQDNLDFSLGQVFTKTISGATTLTFSNAVTGDVKLCYMAGDAPTLPTGSILSGAWVAGQTNVIQIAYTGSVYLYSISQLS